MKNMSIKVTAALLLLITSGLGAYTFKVCYNGSQDPKDTNIPETISVHEHAQGGRCWADNFTVSVPLNNFTLHDVTPRAGDWNCVMVPETVNGNAIRPWDSGSWQNLKPIGAGQTWQIFKTKDPQTVGKTQRFDPRTRTFTKTPIQISWFADVQDGIHDCQIPSATTLPTKAQTTQPVTPPTKIAERHVKAAGILPYCIDPETKQVKILIGKGPTKHKCVLGLFNCSMDKWADFGGSVEEKDYAHHPTNPDDAIKETAARETHEETMGFFTRTLGKDARSKEETEKAIKIWTEKLQEENRVKTKAGYDYWLAKIPCTLTQTSELRDLHNIMYAKASWSSSISTPWVGGAYFLWKIDSDIEKTDFRWVPVQDILEQLDATASNPKAPVFIKDPEKPSQILELYSRFAQSLREGRDVLARINGPLKKMDVARQQKRDEEGMKQLTEAEKIAFTNMVTDTNEIKKNLTNLLEQYKNALANKNKEAVKEIAQQMSDELMKINQLMTKISQALNKNTALGQLMKDRLSPTIQASLHTTAEKRSNVIMNVLQDMLYGITKGVQKVIKIARWPLAGYYLSEHWDELNENPQQAIVLSAGVAGTIGLLEGLAYMLKRGPELTETPEEILRPFEFEIARADQAEKTILKALDQEKKTK